MIYEYVDGQLAENGSLMIVKSPQLAALRSGSERQILAGSI